MAGKHLQKRSPTTPGVIDDVKSSNNPQHNELFVTKLDATDSTLVYSTFLDAAGIQNISDIGLTPIRSDAFVTRIAAGGFGVSGDLSVSISRSSAPVIPGSQVPYSQTPLNVRINAAIPRFEYPEIWVS